MNRGIIFALGALTGAVAGVVGTYLYMENKFNRVVENEVETFKRDWKERHGGPDKDISADDLVEAPSEAVSSPVETSFDDNVDGEPDRGRKDDYDALIKGLNAGKFDYTKCGKKAPETEEEMEPHFEKKPPYILPNTDLWDEANEYEKIELIYYPVDKVFTDYDDQVIDINIEDIGQNNMDVLDEDGNGIDMIYVMNEYLNTIYEISMEEGKSYAEDVYPTIEG